MADTLCEYLGVFLIFVCDLSYSVSYWGNLKKEVTNFNIKIECM